VALEDAVQPVRLVSAEGAVAGMNGRGGGVGKLEFLAVGTPPPNPGEFLGTKGIADLLSSLSERADIVFVDAPPLLAVGDTLSLGAVVDAIVVMTRAGVVTRPMLSDLARVLQTLPATKLGFVITGAGVEETYGYGEPWSHSELDDRVVELEQPQSPAFRSAHGS
jgi:tyrosine-protein kinase Etk/Wzc